MLTRVPLAFEGRLLPNDCRQYIKGQEESHLGYRRKEEIRSVFPLDRSPDLSRRRCQPR